MDTLRSGFIEFLFPNLPLATFKFILMRLVCPKIFGPRVSLWIHAEISYFPRLLTRRVPKYHMTISVTWSKNGTIRCCVRFSWDYYIRLILPCQLLPWSVDSTSPLQDRFRSPRGRTMGAGCQGSQGNCSWCVLCSSVSPTLVKQGSIFLIFTTC